MASKDTKLESGSGKHEKKGKSDEVVQAAPNYHRFVGKSVIVTGGASGIGEAAVKEFAQEGALVGIFDINVTSGRKLAKELAEQGLAVHFYEVDVSKKEEASKAAAEFAKLNHGQIHHLFNNAVYFGSKGLNATQEDFRKSFDVNVIGYANMVQVCHPFMKAAGGKGCAIVNNASISGHIAQPVRWTYSATKGAVLTMTRCMALDLSADGVRVNSISPAWVWSPEVAKAAVDGGREKWGPIWGKMHMLRRVAECCEIARTVLFLCSSDASFITATDLPVDGGYLAMSAEGLGEFSSFAGSKESATASGSDKA